MNKETHKKFYRLIKLIFKAVATAMGVAVAAMSIMGKIDVQSAVMLLGIGLAGSGVAALMSGKDKE